jgi:DNA-directed RNA polymerase subunit K/omega
MNTSIVALASSTSTAVRITPPNERRTSRYLSKYEVAKVVGERAKQIASGTRYTNQRMKSRQSRDWGLGSSGHGHAAGAPTTSGGMLIPLTPDSMMAQLASSEPEVPPLAAVRSTMMGSDPVRIAQLELIHKRIPFIIRREFPDGHFEDIPLRDLEVDEALLNI